MKKLLIIFITLFLINSSLSAVENCQTHVTGDDTKCETCKENYLATKAKDKCLLGCAEEGTEGAVGTCKTCKEGYTLADGACTAKASNDASKDNSKDSKTDPGDEDDSSFGLHYSLLLGLFAFLF